ncbi:MAG: ABC transporter ATP-binding protein [Acidimicrobiia bacterium]|nr:ABC transporter ATP-binding protein [Acidimicrobiia bacterium]
MNDHPVRPPAADRIADSVPAPGQTAPVGLPTDMPPPTGPGLSAPIPPTAGWADRDLAIRAIGLTKRFGAHTAVDGINLTVPTGSFYGLLGPNGAGKSTTLAMAVGLLRPDAGNIVVNNLPVWPDPTPVKATIGVVPEDLLLFERLTAREYLTYVGRFRNLNDDQIRERSGDLLKALDLELAANKLIADFSQGMRKKISLAAALIHSPPLLILDEPFESVDPVSQRSIRHILDHLIDRGRTVIFSSHVMATVEELCDSVAIMDEGRIVRAGPIGEVTAGRRLDDVFAEAVGTDLVGPPSLDWLQ